MKKDIKSLIERIINTYKRKKHWSYIVGALSCIVFFVTIYHLITPAMSFSWAEEPDENGLYTLTLKDSFQDVEDATKTEYAWKEEYFTQTSPEYILDLYFEDEEGNLIKGKDVTIEIGANALEDKIHGFGVVPATEDTAGVDLIKEFDLNRIVTTTGEIYEFVEAKIKIDDTDTWYSFEKSSLHRHIWCQYAGKTTDKGDYGWRGEYLDSKGDVQTYKILNENKDNFKYKFIYKKVRYGNETTDPEKTVASLGADSGIKFKMFNYTGDLSGTGENNINNNGTYDYFAFRDSSKVTTDQKSKTNASTDADGFGLNRAHVESKLDANGYPVFDCKTKGNCTNNLSLGYLFGATTNPAGVTTKGVTAYNPSNTLLQKETINGVEYYYYDSNRNAVDYDTENNHFMVRRYVERGESMSAYPSEAATRYEFMPFNYWNDYSSEYTKNNITYNYATKDIDHWFGMTMEFEFYMPKDGQINGEDMIFSFSGDDDVWVFIDDVLVLDLGGTHGAVDGSINFRTGEVEGYLNWNGKNHKEINETEETDYYNETTIYEAYETANSTGGTTWKEVTNAENETTSIYADYTKHTLKFFYLERGAAVSNCKIRFNIPVLPSGSLSVKKEFDGVEQYGESFGFTLYDTTTGINVPVKEAEYTLKASEQEDTTSKTDENGNFNLKVGEEAIFKLENGHTYSVIESNTGNNAESYKCSLDGNDCVSATETGNFQMTPDSAHQAVFTNKVKTYDLEVSKEALDETTEKFDFVITVKNKFGSPVDIPSDSDFKYTVTSANDTATISFSLAHGESITIKGIPVDTEVTLQEINHDGYHTIIKADQETLADGDTYKFTMDEANAKAITVQNIPGVVLPETGGTGIWSYLVIGTMLILSSLIYGSRYYFKLKEGDR